MKDLHDSTEILVQFAYQHLQPEHFKVEDYCTTVLLRLAAAERCIAAVIDTLERSRSLGDGEVQIRLVKESESLLFHLAGTFEAFGQLLNLLFQLGLPEETIRKGGKLVKGVSFNTAVKQFTNSHPHPSPLSALFKDSMFKTFVAELLNMRHQVTHRKLLEYHSKIFGNLSWQPYVNVNGSAHPLLPYLRKLSAGTEAHIQSAFAALVTTLKA